MSSSTPDTVWYRNVTHDTLHEVEKGSPTEKRLRREQREVYDDDSDEPTFEPAFERLTAAEVKKAQENPEKIPGFPAASVAAAKAKADAEARQAKRDEALDAVITGGTQGDATPAGK